MAAAALGRFLAPIVNRIRMMVARGVVRTIGDGTKMQVVQISLLADEVIRVDAEKFDVAHWNAPKGVFVIFVEAKRQR
jgi:phage gp45-like